MGTLWLPGQIWPQPVFVQSSYWERHMPGSVSVFLDRPCERHEFGSFCPILHSMGPVAQWLCPRAGCWQSPHCDGSHGSELCRLHSPGRILGWPCQDETLQDVPSLWYAHGRWHNACTFCFPFLSIYTQGTFSAPNVFRLSVHPSVPADSFPLPITSTWTLFLNTFCGFRSRLVLRVCAGQGVKSWGINS